MTISTFRVFARNLRRNTVLAAVVSMAPLLGACVSAVDDSSAFGFNNNGSQTASAEGEKPAGETVAEGEGDVAGDAATAPDAADDGKGDRVAAASGANETQAAAVAPTQPGAATGVAPAAEADAAAAQKDGDIPIASGRTAIAAYAGATVSPSSETAQPTAAGSGSKANSTLFASLFAESKAKTPVRNAEVGKTSRVLLKREGPPVEVEPESGGDDAAGVTAMASLPGVKSRASLFEIGQRASADYDAEILEEANGEEGTYEVASLSGMARLSPNGLLVQRPDVQTGCFEPQLVSMIRAIEKRFNTKVVVTSGYRSPSHNKRVNGARRSMHMACKAADIQVPGADKFAVATFVRGLPGRGGVGTYCHTTAIHVDIGRQRDWNWACRRRRV